MNKKSDRVNGTGMSGMTVTYICQDGIAYLCSRCMNSPGVKMSRAKVDGQTGRVYRRRGKKGICHPVATQKLPLWVINPYFTR